MQAMFASLAVAAVLVAQAEPGGEKPTTATVHPYEIATRYDRVRDSTSLNADLGEVFEDVKAGVRMRLSLFRGSPGASRPALEDGDEVGFMVVSSSPSWEFLGSHRVSILADAFRLKPEAKRRGDVERDGGVSEGVSWRVTLEQFKRIAAASEVEIAVGDRDFRLHPQQVAALRDVAARLSVSSEEAEKIAAAHALLVRARRRELREAADAAVAKARAEVEALPRKRRATEAQKVGMAKFDEEFRPANLKYRPTTDELQELLDAYPEFDAAAPKGRE